MTDSFVDLSDNNATPNLAAYAASGRTSIALKATEGTRYVWFGGNTLHDQSHSEGLAVGRYGWPRPEFAGVVQAEAFVRAVEPHIDPTRGDWWFGDVEASYNYSTRQVIPDPPGWAAQIEAFQARIHELLPEVPGGAYTGNWYCQGKPALTAVLKRWPVILSDYSDASPPPNPLGFQLAAHQYTDSAAVAGCPSRVDDNHWLNRAALTALTDELEQIMQWYPSKAAFQADLRAQAAAGVLSVLTTHGEAVHEAAFAGFNEDANGHRHTAYTIARTVRDEQHAAAAATAGPDVTEHAPDPSAAARPTPWPQHRATPHDVTGA